ncbi:hypothetical protein LCGC14_2912300 [marine sediment metagenome]|uniref:Uncharacterized protein n=1 Tax=marine sediment metagenome TaxID=412755 RepID=A0A0F8XRL6_9ZZZZ
MAQQMQIAGTNGKTVKFNNAEVDEITPSLTIITIPHNRIHVGDMYSASHLFIDVASTADAEILVKVGSNKFLHFIFSVSAGAEAYVYFFENPTITDDGTTVNIYNMNRRSSNTSDITVYQNPTIGAVGTQLSTDLLPGAVKKMDVGGNIRQDTEWVLKENNNYLIRATNNGAGAESVAIQLEWYEVSV